MIVVASAVRLAVRKAGARIGADALEQLDADVLALVELACRRAAANGRRTVQAHDFSPPAPIGGVR